MEILIELTEDQLQEVSGGSGSVTFGPLSVTASGTTATVSGTLTIASTASSASLSATFSSSSPEAHLLWGAARGIRAASQ